MFRCEIIIILLSFQLLSYFWGYEKNRRIMRTLILKKDLRKNLHYLKHFYWTKIQANILILLYIVLNTKHQNNRVPYIYKKCLRLLSLVHNLQNSHCFIIAWKGLRNFIMRSNIMINVILALVIPPFINNFIII